MSSDSHLCSNISRRFRVTSLNPNLNFGGNCEEAFRFYEGIFGCEGA